MTWTYDAANLDTSTASGRLNVVRFLVGDTNTTDQQVSDEEINFSLNAASDDVYYAASLAAKAIYATYARLVNTELDGALRADYSDLATNYKALSSDLLETSRKFGGKGLGGAYGGGLTQTDVETKREDTTLVQPSFRRDRFRIPTDDYHDYNYTEE